MQPIASNVDGTATLTAAQTAVLLSYVSYLTDAVNDIGNYLPGWQVVWNGQVTEDGNYALIAKDSNNNYALAIRGSLPVNEIFQNWYTFANWVIEDLDVLPTVPWPYATTADPRIGNGTNTAFNNVTGMQDTLGSNQSIVEYLTSNVVSNNYPLLITGHSLGGNLANVYSSYFVSAIANPAYVQSSLTLYTFAAPAAGNSDYATDLDSKLPNAWHYHNFHDIVPAFPVFGSVTIVSLFYDPSPAASQITVTFEGITVSLREAFLMLAATFLYVGFTQQSNHYEVFTLPLDPSYEQNTAEDFFQQAGQQHAIVNYAGYLGITIPTVSAVV